MKNKKKVLIGMILGLVAVIVAIFVFMSSRGIWFSTGRCLITTNNEYMLVLDESPSRMITNKEHMFHGLESGDEILVLHGIFLDSYPGETDVYLVVKLSDGDISDISEEVINQLTELGWILEYNRENIGTNP